MLPFASTRAAAAGAAVGFASAAGFAASAGLAGAAAAGAAVGAAGAAAAGAAVGFAASAGFAGALVGAAGAVGAQARSRLASTKSLATTDTALQRLFRRPWTGALRASLDADWCTIIVSPPSGVCSRLPVDGITNGYVGVVHSSRTNGLAAPIQQRWLPS